MKKLKSILFASFGMMLLSMSLQGCLITEECSREGLTVYTNNWPEQNWVSTCLGGFWVDVPTTEGDKDVLARFPACTTIACYSGATDCECIESYPVEERRKRDPNYDPNTNKTF